MYSKTFIGLKIYDTKLRRKKAEICKEYKLFIDYCDKYLDVKLKVNSPYSKFNLAGNSKEVIIVKEHKKRMLKLIKKRDTLKISSESWN
ncbi:hypothetical protein BW731_02130 [Vagococcus martis]|uniref:Uncharacterized protein n=1 Tax=Vagococcus martis TaxID=1768210 RepID=A0A1V4DFJ1_9ENTE|nr:hypothetical protein [Vagococcus martis]OPF87086.1 hypothetical protein BW731_02130 [Vagococcus martis]